MTTASIGFLPTFWRAYSRYRQGSNPLMTAVRIIENSPAVCLAPASLVEVWKILMPISN